jgi:DUF4097 and DUF4098 domain-containing protein YvlB
MRWSAVGVVMCTVAVAGCSVNLSAERFTDREERRFTVSGTPDIVLSTYDGGIEVRAWDKPEVVVTVEKQAESLEEARKIAVKFEQSGSTITVTVPKWERSAGVGFNIGRSANLILSVPKQSNLQAHSGDGGITVEGLEGRIDVTSGDGGIRGQALVGDIKVRTGDGGVSLDAVRGRVQLTTGDGGVTVNGTLTALNAHTGDGGVTVRALPGSQAEDEWEITSGDGSVSVELPDTFNAQLDAHTGDGRITVEGFSVPPFAKDDEDHSDLRAQLGAGGKTLRLRTGDGSIRLTKS